MPAWFYERVGRGSRSALSTFASKALAFGCVETKRDRNQVSHHNTLFFGRLKQTKIVICLKNQLLSH